jgi:hypothetical protein
MPSYKYSPYASNVLFSSSTINVGEITGLIRDVKDPFFKYIAAAAD